MSAAALWWLTLGIGLVVTGVVAGLLAAIIASARRIRRTLEEIWRVGQSIANNTAHVDLLRRMNLTASDMLASAEITHEYTRRIEEHARHCPGCPRCASTRV